jgi:hypothetical protein
VSEANEGKLVLIRRLLAKADGAATPAEAQAYAEKAAELMARHGVDEALARAQLPTSDDPIERKRIPLDRPYPHEKGHLLWNIGTGLDVRVIWNRVGATMFGHRSAIEQAELLYTQLLLWIAGPMTEPVPPPFYGAWTEAIAANTRMVRKSWLTGFGDGIGYRMREAKRAATVAAEERGHVGAGLVLVSRKAAVDKYVADTHGKVRIHGARKLDSEAHAQGVVAAQQADLGLTDRVGGGSSRRALT